MKFKKHILILCISITNASFALSQSEDSSIAFKFLGDTISIKTDRSAYTQFSNSLSGTAISDFYSALELVNYKPIINTLLEYRNKEKLDDWLYYQLIRKAAQQVSPKANNYYSYTIYKWFLLTKSGYDAMLRISDNKILFYVQSDEIIYNIPFLNQNNKQYVCLNYHDYGNDIDFTKEQFMNVELRVAEAKKAFTYKVNQLPELRSTDYVEKDLQFNYYENKYHFKIKLNPEVKTLFTNYPAGDYSNQFSIPLTKETYNSLIPQLKQIVGKMKTVNGVDYLMHFTRYAFLYQKDTDVFGREKRLSPEETLLYETSDCEDRAALFFFLVKEIYNLPMIVLSYPNHVTVAVNFDKPIGKPIIYNGSPYYVCDPTPQKKDLHIGKSLRNLSGASFEIVYAYQPTKK